MTMSDKAKVTVGDYDLDGLKGSFAKWGGYDYLVSSVSSVGNTLTVKLNGPLPEGTKEAVIKELEGATMKPAESTEDPRPAVKKSRTNNKKKVRDN
jgi:hypothetical protein